MGTEDRVPEKTCPYSKTHCFGWDGGKKSNVNQRLSLVSSKSDKHRKSEGRYITWGKVWYLRCDLPQPIAPKSKSASRTALSGVAAVRISPDALSDSGTYQLLPLEEIDASP